MKITNFLKKNNYNILLPILTVISFTTWYLKFDFIANIYIYFSILILLTLLKQNTSSLMLVVLFSAFATYSNELYLLYQLLFVYVVIYFIIRNIKRFTKTKGNLFWPLTLIALFSIITILWSPSKLDALAEFLVIIQGIVTYFIVVNDEEGNVITPKNIAWFTTFLLLVLSSQYLILTYEYFPKALSKAHLSQLWINPNLVAATLGLIWIPSLYKYAYAKDNKYILLYLPFEIMTIYAIYMSMSRGLYFGYIIGGVIFIMMLFKIKIKNIIKYLIYILTIIMILITLLVIFRNKDIDTFNTIDKFSSGRLSIYVIALNRLKSPSTFIFGDGIGSAMVYLRLAGKENIYYHSWFYQILTTRGIISLLIQVSLMIKILNMLNNNQRHSKYILLGIIVYLSHSLIDIGYDYQFLGMLYYMLIGTVERNNNEMMYNSNTIVKTS